MGKIVVGSGRARVEIDGVLADGLLDEIRDAVGREVVDVVLQTAEQLRADAERTWPVRTGASRASLAAAVRVTSDPYVLQATITSTDYARFIVSSKVGKNYVTTLRPRSPVTELRKAVVRVRPDLQAKVKEAIVRRLREVTNG